MLHFHDKIIKTGNGKSCFAIRFNKLSKGEVVSPYARPLVPSDRYENYVWDMSAKSVSEDNCYKGATVDACCGIYAMTMEHYMQGKDYLKKEIESSDNNIIMLIEYTVDDVIYRYQNEICLRQCNIVFSCQKNEFEEKMNDFSIFDMMVQFMKEKENAPINSYASPIREYDIRNLAITGDIKELRRVREMFMMLTVLSNCEGAGVPRAVAHHICTIKICKPEESENMSISLYLQKHRNEMFGDMTDKEFETLNSILSNEKGTKETQRMKDVVNDAFVLCQMLHATPGVNVYDLRLKSSRNMLKDAIIPMMRAVR